MMASSVARGSRAGRLAADGSRRSTRRVDDPGGDLRAADVDTDGQSHLVTPLSRSIFSSGAARRAVLVGSSSSPFTREGERERRLERCVADLRAGRLRHPDQLGTAGTSGTPSRPRASRADDPHRSESDAGPSALPRPAACIAASELRRLLGRRCLRGRNRSSRPRSRRCRGCRPAHRDDPCVRLDVADRQSAAVSVDRVARARPSKVTTRDPSCNAARHTGPLQRGREREQPPIAPHRHDELVAVAGQVDVAPLRERQRRPAARSGRPPVVRRPARHRGGQPERVVGAVHLGGERGELG